MKETLLKALELAFEKIAIFTQTIDDADARHLVNINFQEILEKEIDQKEYQIERLLEEVALAKKACTEKDERISELESLEAFHTQDDHPEYPTLFTLDNIVYFENSNGVFMELQDGEHVGVPVQITYEEYIEAVNRYIKQ